MISCLLANDCLDLEATNPLDILDINCIIRIPFINPNPKCGAYIDPIAAARCPTSPNPLSCLLDAATLAAGATKILQCLDDDSLCGTKADLAGLLGCITDTASSGKTPFECLVENLVLSPGVSNLGSCLLEEAKCANKFNVTDLVSCALEPDAELFACLTDNVAIGSGIENLGQCLTEDEKCGGKVNVPGGLACTRACEAGDTSCTLGCILDAIGLAPGFVTLTDCLANEDKCANDIDIMGLVSCVQQPDANILECVNTHINLATGLIEVGQCVVGPCREQFDIVGMVLCVVTTEDSLLDCALESINFGEGVTNALRCILEEDICGDKIDIDAGIACAATCEEDADSECLVGCFVNAISISPAVVEIAGCLMDDSVCGEVFDLAEILACFSEQEDILAGLTECAGLNLPNLPTFPPRQPTAPPTQAPPRPPTPPPAGTPSDRSADDGSDSFMVAGGVLGAFAGAGLLAGAVLFWRKDKAKYADNFHSDIQKSLIDTEGRESTRDSQVVH